MKSFDRFLDCIEKVLQRRDPHYGINRDAVPPLTDAEANEALAMWMGSAKSERKAAAARENGKKGGRPRKKKEGNSDVR